MKTYKTLLGRYDNRFYYAELNIDDERNLTTKMVEFDAKIVSPRNLRSRVNDWWMENSKAFVIKRALEFGFSLDDYLDGYNGDCRMITRFCEYFENEYNGFPFEVYGDKFLNRVFHTIPDTSGNKSCIYSSNIYEKSTYSFVTKTRMSEILIDDTMYDLFERIFSRYTNNVLPELYVDLLDKMECVELGSEKADKAMIEFFTGRF